jgi:hypothetical protein
VIVGALYSAGTFRMNHLGQRSILDPLLSRDGRVTRQLWESEFVRTGTALGVRVNSAYPSANVQAQGELASLQAATNSIIGSTRIAVESTSMCAADVMYISRHYTISLVNLDVNGPIRRQNGYTVGIRVPTAQSDMSFEFSLRYESAQAFATRLSGAVKAWSKAG